MKLVFHLQISDNNYMAGAHRGNLCAKNKKHKQKRAPGGRATAIK